MDSSYEEEFFDDLESFSISHEISDNRTKCDDNQFQILSIDDIVQHVFQIIFDVHSIILVPTTTVRVLLAHYNWDHKQLIDEYFDNDPETFFAKANVIDPFKEVPASNFDCDGAEECKICYTDVSNDSIFGLECGHKYCKRCWNQYLTVKIVDEGLNQLLVCMEPKCNIIVNDDVVMNIVEDATVKLKYQYFMTNSFVQFDQSLRWCPSPDCSYAAKRIISNISLKPCVCKCGEYFCFECGDLWHEPVTCKQLEKFKLHDDTENYKWILANAKSCPKCIAAIEKNAGCNHMTCRNCRHEFCWICMAPWNGHSACNRYVEVPNTAETFLARYKHYRDRYGNQLQSLKIERKYYKNVDTRVKQLQDMSDMTCNEAKFLSEAIDTLYTCRRTLIYTFVFAFYLQRNNQVEIFEDNQGDLETAVERLSGYLGQEITIDNLKDMRVKIIDSFKYCMNRCNVLMEHVSEGKEKKWFQMSS